jgi:TP901 family phage tail tape measure protein
MATQVASLYGVLDLKDQQFTRGLQNAEKGLTGLSKSLKSTADTFTSIGQEVLTKVTAPMVAGLGLATKAAMDFEYQFADVVKTVDATDEQLDALYGTIRKMSTDASNPLSALDNAHATLAEIMSLGGQLGIATEDLERFTTTIGALGVATNLTTEDAATQIAQLANITGLTADEYDKFAGALVQLGNNSATTERDIMNMASRISLASTQLGIAEWNILAFAGAISSANISAELGGTNFSKFLNEITSAVATGGKELNAFARVSGLSAEAFSKLWGSDATEALMHYFLPALNKMSAGDQLLFFEEVGITAMETQQVIRVLAGNIEGLYDAWDHSFEGWSNGTAHLDEAAQKAATVQGSMNRLRNTLRNVGISIGNALLPPLEDLLGLIQPAINSFAEWAEKNPAVIKAITGMTLAISGLGVAFIAIGQGIKIASSALSGIGLLFNPITLAMGVVATAAGGLYLAWRENFLGIRNVIDPILDGIGATIKNFQLLLSGGISFEQFVEATLKNIENVKAWVEQGIKGVMAHIYTLLNPDDVAGSRQAFLDAFGLSGLSEWFNARDLTKKVDKFFTDTKENIRKGIILIRGAIVGFFTGETPLDLVELLGFDTAMGFTNLMQNVRERLGELVSGIASFIRDNAPKIGTELTNLARDMSSRLGTLLADFLIWAGNAVINIIPVVLEWGPKILGGILIGFGVIGKWVWDNIVSPFIQSIVDKFPELLNVGLGVVGELIKGLGNAGIDLFNAAVDLANQIFGGLGQVFSGIGGWLQQNLIDPIRNSMASLFNTSSYTGSSGYAGNSAINRSVASGGYGGGSISGGGALNLFAHHASGGNVEAGNPYWVGERTPEVFIPNTSGRIATAEEMGMGGGDTYNITIQANDYAGGQAAGRAFENQLQSIRRRRG